MLSYFTTVFTLIAALALSGCGGGGEDRIHRTTPPPPARTLSSIAVTAANPNVPVGLTQQFTATGTFSDASTGDITNTVTWSSSAPGFATINATSGVATSIALGSAMITATSGSITGTATLTATAPVLTSLTLTPNPLQGWVGSEVFFSVSGTYSDGTTHPPSSLEVAWGSSTPSVATTVGPGLIDGKSVGSTTISATAGSVTATAIVNVAANPWSTTGSMSTPRDGHTAIALADGRVLVTGGFGGTLGGGSPVNSSEIYDPASGNWTNTGNMAVGRSAHTATLFANGKVLVVGGYSGIFGGPFASAELYDPASGAWTPASSLSIPRTAHTATLLPDGSVLVAGGVSTTVVAASAEIYDPVADTWKLTGNLTVARAGHGATLLPNGKVLVSGGNAGPASAELYDPATGTWTATGSPVAAVSGSTAMLLKDGRVMVLGATNDAEIYDPGTAAWKATANLVVTQGYPQVNYPQAALRGDGTVLVVGVDANQSILLAEIYDPVADVWAPTANRGERLSETLTPLRDGSVLVAGGDSYQGRLSPPITLAELYK